MKKATKSDERLFMMRDGVLKEIDMNLLQDKVVKALEDAYDQSPVIGISRDTYIGMAELLADRIAVYSTAMERISSDSEMKSSKTFVNEFGFNCLETPLMLDGIFWVDAMMSVDQNFTSRSVNQRSVKRELHSSYAEMAKEFRESPIGDLFRFSGLKVGFIKFLKFYYSVAKCAALPQAACTL